MILKNVVYSRPNMKQINRSAFALLVLFVMIFSGCQDAFEKVRRSTSVQQRLDKAFDYYKKEDFAKAQLLFEDLIPLIKVDTIGEKVFFMYAYTHYNQKSYALASYYFKQFFNTYGNSAKSEEALFMSAMSQYKLSPTYRLDQSETNKAIEGFQMFANSFPGSNRVDRCNRMIDEMRGKLEFKAYESAYLYYKISDFKAAVYSFQQLLQDYPDTENAEKVKFMIIKSDYHLAVNSVTSKQRERFEETLKQYLDFVDTYPSSTFKKEAEDIYDKAQAKLAAIKKGSY